MSLDCLLHDQTWIKFDDRIVDVEAFEKSQGCSLNFVIKIEFVFGAIFG